jgi:dienelactone hydrolase
MRVAVRSAAATAGLALLALSVGLGIVLVPVLRDPTERFLDRKGRIASARETATWSAGDATLAEVTVISTSGLEVDFTVRVPREAGAEPRPLVVILAGQGTGRDAARYAADSRGVVVAALSYPYRRELPRGTLALLGELPAMQRAILDTGPAVLLATDWLLQQPYVDPQRVELAGGSFGAFLVAVPGALDPRFRRVWLVHGGGDPPCVIEHGLRSRIELAPARRVAALLAATIAGSRHLAPEKWVGRISPRPVICINALDDESIPHESVAALHRALREPSEVIWMPGGHVLPERGETIRQLTDLVFTRVAEADADP